MSRTRRVPVTERTRRPHREGKPETVKCPECRRLVDVAEGGYNENEFGQFVWVCLECA